MSISSIEERFWGKDDPRRMPRHFFFGVVRFDYRTAKRANVEKQNYSMCPRYWYVDSIFLCCDCGKEFEFTADEQEFWYEEMRFYVDSIPKRCGECRKAARTRLELRRRYDAMIAEGLESKDAEVKRSLVQVIDELEAAGDAMPEKMKENRARLTAQLAKIVSE